MSDTNFIPVCEPLLGGNELKYITEAVESGWISSSGKYINAFEKKFSEFNHNRFAVATTNGTTALHLALVALGVGPGDEVIIPSFTMAASAFAICYTGAIPVFVDATPDTWNINEALIEEKITKKTKAIMTVSIFGHPCELDKILALKEKYGIALIEDAAEAHGAKYGSKQVSEYADITTYSFFANKHLTTGEGGMVTTNNEALYDRCRYFKNMCFSLDGNRNYLHGDIGFNYRMSNLHAAIGLSQVEKVEDYIHMRIRNGELYKKYLSDIQGISIQAKKENVTHVYWMNGVVIDSNIYGNVRNELRDYLTKNNIETRLFFAGMHKQPSLKNYGCDCSGQYPVSDFLTENGFYLPSGSLLNEQQIEYICSKINLFLKEKMK